LRGYRVRIEQLACPYGGPLLDTIGLSLREPLALLGGGVAFLAAACLLAKVLAIAPHACLKVELAPARPDHYAATGEADDCGARQTTPFRQDFRRNGFHYLVLSLARKTYMTEPQPDKPWHKKIFAVERLADPESNSIINIRAFTKWFLIC
jgi:hypothetical protein